MNKSKSLLLSLLFLTPAVAMAEQVTCESRDNKRVECSMNTRGVVVVVKQLSNTACVENKNWGLNKSSIWVSGGCRAVFALEDSGASSGNDYNNASNSNAGPSQVTCESQDGRRTECSMNTRGVVRVVRQLSKTACVENRNWGLNKSSIWVSDGCRAEFALEGASGTGGNSAPDAAIRGCNRFADNGYDGTIETQSALKPGYWEIILRFEQYRYVCNVNDRGEVSEFNKLN